MWFFRAKTLEGFAYLTVWLVFIFLIAISCVALLAEAVRSSPSRSWNHNYNVFVLGGAYFIVIVMSIALCLKRRISMFRRMQRISKGHMAIGKHDIPAPVHELILQQYARTALIAYKAIPTDVQHEGWGHPNSKYPEVHYRRALLDSVRELDSLARLLIPSQPRMRPRDRILHHFRFIAPLLPKDQDGLSPLQYYDSAIQLARNAEREPTEREYEIGISAARQIKTILDEVTQEMMEGSNIDLTLNGYG